MANPFQQKARQRKVIYLALIVALFTVSLLHRRLIVEKQAENLQLREVARGEVEMTSSFVRLSLTGSRGLATTILWATAIDRMAKHEWNELELLVNSISTLQPYFITPWVYQSWNLAFNVAVECDRPRDKYYYISRGLEFLAEGERRNQGTADIVTPGSGRPSFPGNPDMRFYMGFYYQLKLGTSDEKNTMRCLLDLSCIDPIKRNPERFWKNQRDRQEVDREELARFCQNYPRLVRRLREQLKYESPKQIVQFLEANREVPSRFKKNVAADQKESIPEEPRKQFPILPPVEPREARPETGPAWPKPKQYDLTPEALDVFLICRTWYQYAQEPLPPPLKDPGVTEEERKYAQELDRLRREQHITYRMNKGMAEQLFRGYPSRAQFYIAEKLQEEGWFDDGWIVTDWFDQAGGEDLEVGTETKYRSRPAWQEAHRMHVEFGLSNGLYLAPADAEDLQRKAQAIRAKYKMGPYDMPRPEWRAKFAASFDAQQKLIRNSQIRTMTNYDSHLIQTEAEQDPEAVRARKLLYHALRLSEKDHQEALPLYEQAWPLWIDISLRYPKFPNASLIQDDVYEAMLKYLRLTQKTNPTVFRATMLGMAQFAVWPHPNWEKLQWIDRDQLLKIVTVRVAQGPLELVAYYEGPDPRRGRDFSSEVQKVRDYWFGVTFAATRLGQLSLAPPVPMPDQQAYALAGSIWERRAEPPPGLRYLIDQNVVNSLRERYGLLKPRQGATPTSPAASQAVPVVPK